MLIPVDITDLEEVDLGDSSSLDSFCDYQEKHHEKTIRTWAPSHARTAFSTEAIAPPSTTASPWDEFGVAAAVAPGLTSISTSEVVFQRCAPPARPHPAWLYSALSSPATSSGTPTQTTLPKTKASFFRGRQARKPSLPPLPPISTAAAPPLARSFSSSSTSSTSTVDSDQEQLGTPWSSQVSSPDIVYPDKFIKPKLPSITITPGTPPPGTKFSRARAVKVFQSSPGPVRTVPSRLGRSRSRESIARSVPEVRLVPPNSRKIRRDKSPIPEVRPVLLRPTPAWRHHPLFPAPHHFSPAARVVRRSAAVATPNQFVQHHSPDQEYVRIAIGLAGIDLDDTPGALKTLPSLDDIGGRAMMAVVQMQVLWMLVVGGGMVVEANRDRGRSAWRRQIEEAPGVAVASDPFGEATVATSTAISTSAAVSSESAMSITSASGSGASSSIASSASSSASSSFASSGSASSGPATSAGSTSTTGSASASSLSASSASSSASAAASASAPAFAKPAIDPYNTEANPGGMAFMIPIFILLGLTLFYWIWEKRRQQRIAKASSGLTFSPYRKKKPGAKEWRPVDSEDEDEKARVKDKQGRHWKSKNPVTPLPPMEECSSGEEGQGPFQDYSDGRRHQRRRSKRDKDFPDAYEDEYDGEIYHDPGTMYFDVPAGPPVAGFASSGGAQHGPQRGARPQLGPHDYRTLPTEDDLADVLVHPQSRHRSSYVPPPPLDPPGTREFLAPPGGPPPLDRRESARSDHNGHRRHTHDDPSVGPRQHRTRHGREYASHDQDLEAGLTDAPAGMERRRSHAGHPPSHSRSLARAPSRRSTADPAHPSRRPSPTEGSLKPRRDAPLGDTQPSNLRPRAASPTAVLSPPTNPALFFQPGLSTTTVNALAMAQAVPSMTDLALSSEDEKICSIPSTAEKLLANSERMEGRALSAQELRNAENPFSAAKEAQYGVDPSSIPVANDAGATPPPAPLAKRAVGAGASPLTIKRAAPASDTPRSTTPRAGARETTSSGGTTALGRTDSTQPLKKASGRTACPTPPPSEIRRPSPSPATPAAVKKVSKRQKEVASPAKSVRRKRDATAAGAAVVGSPAAKASKASAEKVVESWSSGATVGISESPRAMSPAPPAPAPPPPPGPPPLAANASSTPRAAQIQADRRKSVVSPMRDARASRPSTPTTGIAKAVSPLALSPRQKAMRGGDSPNVEEAAATAAAAAGIEQRLAMIRKLEQADE